LIHKRAVKACVSISYINFIVLQRMEFFLNFLIRDDDGNISLTMLLTASELKHNVRCGVFIILTI